MKNGVPVMIVSCLVLVWLFGGQPAKKVEPIPTDGMIEAVASAQESMVSDAAKNAAVRISEVRAKAELSRNSGQLNSSESPNSSPSPNDRHEKAKREIIIFTRPNCAPCDRWKRCEQTKFEADGWTVAYCDDHDYPLTPTFLVDANNKQTEHRGYLPFEKISEVVK